jgi:exonuclease III
MLFKHIHYNIRSLTGSAPKHLNSLETKTSILLRTLWSEAEVISLTEHWKSEGSFNKLVQPLLKDSHEWRTTNGPNGSLGVAILWRKDKFKYLKSNIDDGHRFVFVQLLHISSGHRLWFKTIYAPGSQYSKKERSEFFENIGNQFKQTKKTLVCGDFNLNPSLIGESILGNAFKDWVSKWKLEESADDQTFNTPTMDHSKTLKRYDLMFSTEDIAKFISPTRIANKCNLGLSDHFPIIQQITFGKLPKPTFLWRLDPNVLEDSKVQEFVRGCLSSAKVDSMGEWLELKHFIAQALEKFDLKRREERRSTEMVARMDLDYCLQKHLKENTEQSSFELKVAQETYYKANVERTAGMREVAIAKYDFLREAPSKVISALLKNKSSQNLIYTLTTLEGEILTDTKDVLEYSAAEFGKIFEKKETSEEAFQKLTTNQMKKLSQQEKEKFNESLTNEEVIKAIRCLKGSSVPGKDGLTARFYHYFIQELSPILTKVLNNFIESNIAQPNFNEGIIIVIPKGDRTSINHFDQMRPVTLLNSDYKILTHVIANRIKTVLDFLIHPDQKGYVQKRQGSEIVFNTITILKEAMENEESIVLLDFSKAFDSVQHDFIWRCLSNFNFPMHFINTCKLISKNATSKLYINKNFSGSIRLDSGVRQGDPLAGLLFILSVEILANSIREDQSIEGINVYEEEKKINLYCDDVTLFLKNGSSFKNSQDKLDIFSSGSGLKTNKKKCKIITKSKNYTTEYGIVSKENPGQLLGFQLNQKELVNPLEEKIQEMDKVLDKIRDSWSSLLGKRLHIQTYAFSKLYYYSLFFRLTDEQEKKINMKIKEALFKMERTSKKGKKFFTTPISISRLCNPKEKGGISLIDVRAQLDSLKTVFARQWLSQEGNCRFLNSIIDWKNKKFDPPWKRKIKNQQLQESLFLLTPFLGQKFEAGKYAVKMENSKIRTVLKITKVEKKEIWGLKLSRIKENKFDGTSYSFGSLKRKESIIASAKEEGKEVTICPLSAQEWSTNTKLRKTNNTNHVGKISNKDVYGLLRRIKEPSESLLRGFESKEEYFKMSEQTLKSPYRNKIREFEYLFINNGLKIAWKTNCKYCNTEISKKHIFEQCVLTKTTQKSTISRWCQWKIFNKYAHDEQKDISGIGIELKKMIEFEEKRNVNMNKQKK